MSEVLFAEDLTLHADIQTCVSFVHVALAHFMQSESWCQDHPIMAWADGSWSQQHLEGDTLAASDLYILGWICVGYI